ncbi:hypothetical protein C8Q76DRAFT_688631 [Earliella scabrosa]|nr:hypothetical protein C8Q76DRAFT_688631 [Earliella scabrosa]
MTGLRSSRKSAPSSAHAVTPIAQPMMLPLSAIMAVALESASNALTTTLAHASLAAICRPSSLFVQGSSTGSNPSSSCADKQAWVTPLRELAEQLQQGQRCTDKIMNTIMKQLQKIQSQLPPSGADNSASPDKGKRRAE